MNILHKARLSLPRHLPGFPGTDSSLGPADFARLVANIAPSLQTLRAQQESISSGVFVYRLMFAVRLAEFHQRRLNGELSTLR